MLPSPCINVCRMDPSGERCLGCWRRLDEIAAWAQADDPTRAAILARVAARRQALPGEDRAPCEGDRHG